MERRVDAKHALSMAGVDDAGTAAGRPIALRAGVLV
jgi:hypothetical protein